MKASQIITDTRRELLETTGSFWSDTELLRLINRGQQDYINKTRILEDMAQLNLQVGRKDYPLPANWLSSKAIFHKDSTSGTKSYKRLVATNLEKMAQEVPNFLTDSEEAYARPNRYWIWNKTLYVSPAPKTVEDSDLWLFYKAKPRQIIDPSDDIDVDESLADGINAYVLWKAWIKEQEFDLSNVQGVIYQSYIKQGLRWQKRKSGDQRNRFDIDSPYYFGSRSITGFDPF